MKKLLTFIKQLFIAELGPLLVSLIFLVFFGYYWSVGFILIITGLATIAINGIGGLLLNFVFKRKTVKTRILITSAFALVVCMVLLLLQLNDTRPNALKSVILTNEIESDFNASKGRIFYPALEEEIYIKLDSNPKLTEAFLNSREYTPTSFNEILAPTLSPSWFPNESNYADFDIYEYNYTQQEALILAFISKDKEVIYAWHLAY